MCVNALLTLFVFIVICGPSSGVVSSIVGWLALGIVVSVLVPDGFYVPSAEVPVFMYHSQLTVLVPSLLC